MRRSDLFATVSKEKEADLDSRSAELMVKAGLVKNFGSGTWSYTHLGKKVLDNIEEVVRAEMDEIAQEVKMHQLQTSDIWKQSGRWENFEDDEFFTLENRDQKDFTIAATHEEAATEFAKDYVRSYRDLDLSFYQIGRKFRDDRARKGLLRAKEFIMKDAYSFHSDRDSLDKKYREFTSAYRRVFDKLGLDYSEVSADNGSMGGSKSHEFMAESEIGSDIYRKCQNSDCLYASKDLEKKNCQRCGTQLREVKGIEIGHCFKLDDRYSSSMDLTYTDEKGEEQDVLMASYGIGVSRLVSAIIEQNHDERGITWNRTISAFKTAVIIARHEDEVEEKAEEIYNHLQEKGNQVLLYDDAQSVGEQFAEADLIGINRKIILGNNYLENKVIEIENRNGEVREVERIEQIL
ncbi:MAG: prolyl-tRNA synthetase [Candidatus Nanohaloarchaea archaeon]